MSGEPRITWDITLALASPMQIGDGTLGMVERTRLYIPNRVLWGALTNAIVQHTGGGRPADYQAVGDTLGRDGKHFECLFPSRDLGASVYLPCYSPKTGKLEWINDGEIEPDGAMRARHTYSLASTPYAPMRPEPEPGQEAGTLHATDLIAPKFEAARRDVRTLHYRGRLQLPAEVGCNGSRIELNRGTISALFGALRLGGGRKRGWGIVAATNVAQGQREPALGDGVVNGHRPLLTPDRPVREGDGLVVGRAFLAAYRQHDDSKGSGQGFSTNPQLHWDIGTVLAAEPA